MATQAGWVKQPGQFIGFTFGMFLGGLTMLVTGFLELLKKNSLGGEWQRASAGVISLVIAYSFPFNLRSDCVLHLRLLLGKILSDSAPFFLLH
jgi:hypothetical protein